MNQSLCLGHLRNSPNKCGFTGHYCVSTGCTVHSRWLQKRRSEFAASLVSGPVCMPKPISQATRTETRCLPHKPNWHGAERRPRFRENRTKQISSLQKLGDKSCRNPFGTNHSYENAKISELKIFLRQTVLPSKGDAGVEFYIQAAKWLVSTQISSNKFMNWLAA